MGKRMVVVAILLVACGGKKKAIEQEVPVAEEPVAAEIEPPADGAVPARAPTGPPRQESRPTRTDAQRSCLRLLAGALGLAADTAPYLDRLIARERNRDEDDSEDDDEDSAHIHTTETADADFVELRGAPPTRICIAWKRLDEYDCSESPSECDDGGPYHSWKTRYVLAVLDREDASVITDQRSFEGNAGDLVVEGSLRWATVAIGPDTDALILTRSDESGATSLARVAWVTIAGGKLLDQFAYRSGIEDGEAVAEVEPEVLKEVSGGRFVVRFRVKIFDEEESSGRDPPLQEDTCRWNSETGTYQCARNLLARIPPERTFED